MRLQIKKNAALLLLLMGAVGGMASLAATSNATVTFQAVVADDDVQYVSIVGGNYFFTPNHVVVKVGVPVELTLVREEGLIPHAFVIHAPEAGIEVDQRLSGDPKRIRFTPTAAGLYPFYCKNRLLFFKSHREEGMEGVLEVVE